MGYVDNCEKLVLNVITAKVVTARCKMDKLWLS